MNQRSSSINRRDFLKVAMLGSTGLLTLSSGWTLGSLAAHAATSTPAQSPDSVLNDLLVGNQRFVRHRLQHPHQNQAQIQAIAQGQHPLVTILSCADSRVAPEILFDQGMGDLFDVRIAGNIATPEAIGSIEYAVVLLGTPLLMVLGHERCGAVTAAVKRQAVPGQISTFVKAIKPAIVESKDPLTEISSLIEQTVVANVQYQIKRLRQSSTLLAERETQGTLKIVGGRYDLDTGEVTLVT
jgi:carbonic anhydrase